MDEESIFAEAVKIQSERERQAFLEKACEGNSELRAQVEQLLSANAAAGSFLENPPIDPGLRPGCDPKQDATIVTDTNGISLSFLEPCDKPGRIGQLGIYEVIEVVGQGGMGIVLRACDTKLNRTVAVKVLAPMLAANPMAIRRFLSEAQKGAAVVHEHVVTIHAVDDVHRPPFLVMEFISGQTLQQKIDREGALQLAPILRIGTQIAEGLAAAHQLGLTHRDIKPANILLENGVERVKIADFGLARAANDVKVTQTGLITGTPLYMSPEQARGESVDQRSDLFSLGAVLYAMCTGRSAFRADSHLAVMRRVCEDTPRTICEVNPEIPEWLATIVERLLEKQPDNRFQDAGEVAELLGNHLAVVQGSSQDRALTPPPAAPSGGRRTPTNLRSRKRVPVTATVLFGAILLAAMGFAAWFAFMRAPHSGAVQWVKTDGGNGHWYCAIVDRNGVEWEEAERRSEAMGGHLVTITSHAEEDFVLRLLDDDMYWSVSPNTHKNGPWLGAIQLDGASEPDGGWRWVTDEDFFYSNWEPTQPNDNASSLAAQQHIRFIAPRSDRLSARWGDSSLRKRSFVVEWDNLPVCTKDQLSKEDSYGILFVEQADVDAERRDIIFRRGPDLWKRYPLDQWHYVFVEPGTYTWQVLIPQVEQETRRGSITIAAGERIVFTSAGPSPKKGNADKDAGSSTPPID